MSRQNERKAQNAASLIRPSMVVKVCADCGAYAVGCYDMEQVKVGDYCPQHAKERGFCQHCGSELTQAEKDRADLGGYCVVCIPDQHEMDDDRYEWDEGLPL
jgi:hypothetical protein